MQWKVRVRLWCVWSLFFAIWVCALLPSSASADGLTENLDYFAYCEIGPCNVFVGGGPGPWEYRSQKFASETAAQTHAVSVYLRKNGWEEAQHDPLWRTRCGPAQVSSTPVAYYPFPQTWRGSVTFTHICHSYRPDGLSPPTSPYIWEHTIAVRAVCKTGYTVKNYDTGECWRQPNDCPRYPENSSYGCGESIAQLEATAKSSIDPRRLFHAQQTCIAKKSCELRCQMDNCQWMEHVIPAFVDPYLGGENLWPVVEASCSSFVAAMAGHGVIGKWIADRECFSTMGWYHVQVDLKDALIKHGCGSQRDWDLVGEQIVPCLRETQPGYSQIYYEMGGVFVDNARERVRQQCRASRPSGSLDINTDVAGKVCALPQ